MRLKCNVCIESPIVELLNAPNHNEDIVLCPSCDKQLAYASEKRYSTKLIWHPIDTEYDYHSKRILVIKL